MGSEKDTASSTFEDSPSCRANPRPCPLLERLAPGDPRVRVLTRGPDLRRCLPRYRVYRRDERGGGGSVFDEVTEISEHWDGGCVAFLLGCSFGFEGALEEAGIGMRHVEEGVTVPMYRTHQATEPCGPFAGPLVVSMRPMSPEDARRAEELTAGFEASHGGPLHIGDPAALGIEDLSAPDYGDPVSLRPGEVPVFWACGVTSQEAVMSALRAGVAEQVITHAPGHMFVGDIPAREARLWT